MLIKHYNYACKNEIIIGSISKRSSWLTKMGPIFDTKNREVFNNLRLTFSRVFFTFLSSAIFDDSRAVLSVEKACDSSDKTGHFYLQYW